MPRDPQGHLAPSGLALLPQGGTLQPLAPCVPSVSTCVSPCVPAPRNTVFSWMGSMFHSRRLPSKSQGLLSSRTLLLPACAVGEPPLGLPGPQASVPML